jgi:nucleoside-diphosphate-sugar epimerase
MKNLIVLGDKSSIAQNFLNLYKKEFNIIKIDYPYLDATKNDFLKKIKKKIEVKKKYIIINFIGRMGADESKNDIEKFLLINGAFPIIPILNQEIIKIEKYIFLSSETIYGLGNNLREENHKNPIHPYAISKLIAEVNIKKAYENLKKKNFPVVILRVPIVIFNKQKFNNTLTSICNDYDNSNNVVIFGNGKHFRKYIAAKDLSKIINIIINKKLDNKLEIYNIPGVKANSLQILEILKKIYKKKSKIKFIDSKKSFSLTSNSLKFKKEFKYDIDLNLHTLVKNYMFKLL